MEQIKMYKDLADDDYNMNKVTIDGLMAEFNVYESKNGALKLDGDIRQYI
jgi:hypothetical protein